MGSSCNRFLTFDWAKVAVKLFYLSEIVTVCVRGYYRVQKCSDYPVGWICTAATQSFINAFCCLWYFAICWKGGYNCGFSPITFLVYVLIIISNIVIIVEDNSSEGLLQLFVDLFGYLLLITFWSNKDDPNLDIKASDRYCFASLHIGFIICIVTTTVTFVIYCDCISGGDVVYSQLEFLLLGHLLAGIVSWTNCDFAAIRI